MNLGSKYVLTMKKKCQNFCKTASLNWREKPLKNYGKHFLYSCVIDTMEFCTTIQYEQGWNQGFDDIDS